MLLLFSGQVLFDSLWPMDWSTPGFPVLHYLLHFAHTHVHWAGTLFNHLILCCHLLLLPSIFPSIRVSSSESALRSGGQGIGPSASASVLPVNIQGDFLYDWPVLAGQGSLTSLLQHHSWKASILQRSAFCMVQTHLNSWLLEKLSLWLYRPLWAKWHLCFLIHCLVYVHTLNSNHLSFKTSMSVHFFSAFLPAFYFLLFLRCSVS